MANLRVVGLEGNSIRSLDLWIKEMSLAAGNKMQVFGLSLRLVPALKTAEHNDLFPALTESRRRKVKASKNGSFKGR